MASIFSTPKWTALATALLVSSVALSGGCTDDPDVAPAPGTPSEPTTSALHSGDAGVDTVPPDAGSFGDYSSEPRTFASESAEVPFTIDLPGGWTALERHADLAQFWEGENEELSIAELTIATDIQGSPADVRREYEVALEGSGTPPFRRARYGPYTVEEIDVTNAPNGLPGGYRMPPGSEVTVVIFDVNGRGVTVLLDPFADVEPPGQVTRMFRQLRAMLQTIRFTEG